MNTNKFKKTLRLALVLCACFSSTANASAPSQQAITQLYIGFFGRAPDPSGLAYWQSVLSAGLDISAAANSFAVSKDAIKVNGSTTSAFVTNVYQNLFGRAPDPSALAYWSLKLSNGNIESSQLILQLINSAQGADKIAIDNKVTVATSITNSLNKTELITQYRPGTDLFNNLKNVLTGVNSESVTVTTAQSNISFITSGDNAAKTVATIVEIRETAQQALKDATSSKDTAAINKANEDLFIVNSVLVGVLEKIQETNPTFTSPEVQNIKDYIGSLNKDIISINQNNVISAEVSGVVSDISTAVSTGAITQSAIANAISTVTVKAPVWDSEHM